MLLSKIIWFKVYLISFSLPWDWIHDIYIANKILHQVKYKNIKIYFLSIFPFSHKNKDDIVFRDHQDEIYEIRSYDPFPSLLSAQTWWIYCTVAYTTHTLHHGWESQEAHSMSLLFTWIHILHTLKVQFVKSKDVQINNTGVALWRVKERGIMGIVVLNSSTNNQ